MLPASITRPDGGQILKAIRMNPDPYRDIVFLVDLGQVRLNRGLAAYLRRCADAAELGDTPPAPPTLPSVDTAPKRYLRDRLRTDESRAPRGELPGRCSAWRACTAVRNQREQCCPLAATAWRAPSPYESPNIMALAPVGNCPDSAPWTTPAHHYLAGSQLVLGQSAAPRTGKIIQFPTNREKMNMT